MALGSNHLNLSPAAEDRSVAFTIPKAVDPYVDEWYTAMKNEGETFNAFLLRLVCEKGVEYKKLSVIATASTDHQTAQTTNDGLLNTDNVTLHAEALALLV